ncbi:MAG TPA: MFS transporter [Jatrophihabitantaceae bacterium]|nr:MFS transporter [Jatrophihabitantaceae bacterium]
MDRAAVDAAQQLQRRGLRQLIAGHVGGLPQPFWWLWLGVLVNRAGTFIEPFFILYLTGPRHVSVQTTGLVLTAWGFGSLISQPIGGVLTDRFGRRATLGASLAATAATLLALGAARDLALIAVLAFVLGTVADMYRPASTAAIADLIDEADRPRAYALQFWAINLGFSVASVSAGLLLHIGFGVLFVLDAITTLVFGLLALRFVPETKPETDDPPARMLDPIRLFRSDRLLLVATVIVLVYAVLYIQANVTLPLAITSTGLHASVYGYVIAINGILIVVAQPFTIRLIARWPQRTVLPISLALVGVGMAATGLSHSTWQFAVTVVMWTVGEIGTAGSFQALIAALAPAGMRGRYAGALGLAWGAADLIAPILGAASFAHARTALWLGCLVAGVAAGAGQYWLLGQVERRRATSLAPAL